MYNTILTYIYNRIYDNGQGEIDPTKMRQVFQQCCNELGADANFMGVATPATNISSTEVKQVYIALPTSSARTFTNFDGLTLTVPAYSGAIFVYDNDAWSGEVVTFDAVKQSNTDVSEDLPLLIMPSPAIQTGDKTAPAAFNKEFTLNPHTGELKAPKFIGDGSQLTNISSQLPAEDYHSYSANESAIEFGSVYSYHEVEVTGATQTFNINIPTGNTFVNYLLVRNTGSSTCTIALAASSGMTWTSFVLPTDAIEVDAGECIELSFISINNHTRLVVTKSETLEITILS